MPWLFGVTMMVSAGLLFWAQPMLAKRILPLLGGSPAVWNACNLFFQIGLLAGYAWAHWSCRWFGRRQPIIHLGLVLVGLLLLPIGQVVDLSAPDVESPVSWLMHRLLLMIGGPFILVAATNPTLQRWYASTNAQWARDPYFLYVASNVGSFVGLLGYPLVLEPMFSLRQQQQGWMIGYVLLSTLLLLCSWACQRRAWHHEATAPAPSDVAAMPVTWRRRWHWILLALAPSSLMLGMTSHLTAEVASAPMFWVIPLALYLLTFILAFAQAPIVSPTLISRLAPILTLLVILSMTGPPNASMLAPLATLHLATFVVLSLMCHSSLAADRPAPSQLTDFYLCLSIGGALGGAFNALAAPLLFRSYFEYPLAIAFAIALRAAPTATGQHRLRWALPLVALGLGAAGALAGAQWTALRDEAWFRLVIVGLPTLAIFMLTDHPKCFAFATLGVIGIATLHERTVDPILLRVRSFFGVHQVVAMPEYGQRILKHGLTIHGTQKPGSCQPTSYYTPNGPIGEVIARIRERQPALQVGIAGLGVGTLLAYGQENDHFTCFEIDPAVVRIAQNPRLFTFHSNCCRAQQRFALGDARLLLTTIDDRSFDLLVIDAFSSDAIPMHLLTTEAMQLYLSKIKDEGMVALHISNRHLDLPRLVAGLAESVQAPGLLRDDRQMTAADEALGKSPSVWAVLAKNSITLRPFAAQSSWQSLEAIPNKVVWTDDRSDLLTLFRREIWGPFQP